VDNSELFLKSAEDIVDILANHRIEAVVIGAVALAAHHYVRQTEDIDLGINASIASHRFVLSWNRSIRQGIRLSYANLI
jgi:predicted nucleotidyltransferase